MTHRKNPILFTDGYKLDHRRQYPPGTQGVYSNLTARSSRDRRYKATVVFGIQGFLEEYCHHTFQQDFFNRDRHEVVERYKRRIDCYLGKDALPVDHIEELHRLGYLPIHVKALPEGTLCPIGVPMVTMRNTHGDFYWVTNYLETLLSAHVWKPITNATIAFEYRKIFHAAAKRSCPEMLEFVPFQGHDFSERGMDGIEAAARSGAAHLLSFVGTDTLPAIDYLEDWYGADAEKELIGCSVPATEHSVMCMGGQETERETFARLMNLYPSGILSVVSDTWDYWSTLTKIAPSLKDQIMARNGKLVFRPDSGDPVKIICGDPMALEGTSEHKGSVRVLWEIFGGTTTSRGFRQLDSHVGLIYGDSITLERAEMIVNGLMEQGFASTNVVFGIGSYTYQYNTRDTFGMAIKATSGVIDGEIVAIQKSPKTDSGLKKSHRGFLRVNADLTVSQDVSEAEETRGILRTVFVDGTRANFESLATIRARLLGNLR